MAYTRRRKTRRKAPTRRYSRSARSVRRYSRGTRRATARRSRSMPRRKRSSSRSRDRTIRIVVSQAGQTPQLATAQVKAKPRQVRFTA